jgi:hypothetical protein
MKHEFFDSLRAIIIHTNVKIFEVSLCSRLSVCAHHFMCIVFRDDENIIQQQQAASADGMIFPSDLTDLICEVN